MLECRMSNSRLVSQCVCWSHKTPIDRNSWYAVCFVCVCVCVFIKLHITAQSGPVILVILYQSH